MNWPVLGSLATTGEDGVVMLKDQKEEVREGNKDQYWLASMQMTSDINGYLLNLLSCNWLCQLHEIHEMLHGVHDRVIMKVCYAQVGLMR